MAASEFKAPGPWAVRPAAVLSIVTALGAFVPLGVVSAFNLILGAGLSYHPPQYPEAVAYWVGLMPFLLWGCGLAGAGVAVGALRLRKWALPAMACWLLLSAPLAFAPLPWGGGLGSQWPVELAAGFFPQLVTLALLIRARKSLE